MASILCDYLWFPNPDEQELISSRDDWWWPWLPICSQACHVPLDTQWGFLTHTATTPLVSFYHPFAVVTRNHQWICRSHSANPPSCLSHLCQGWIWSSVSDVMQKNMGLLDKTAFSGHIIHGPFELHQQNYMEVLASVALTITLPLWHFCELLKHAAVARELPTKAALSLCVWMTNQEILTLAVPPALSLSVLLSPALSALSIF